jgi:hypothetical protein
MNKLSNYRTSESNCILFNECVMMAITHELKFAALATDAYYIRLTE